MITVAIRRLAQRLDLKKAVMMDLAEKQARYSENSLMQYE